MSKVRVWDDGTPVAEQAVRKSSARPRARRVPAEDAPVILPALCEHGYHLGIVAVHGGSTVYSPACTDRSGKMRPHLIGKAGQ